MASAVSNANNAAARLLARTVFEAVRRGNREWTIPTCCSVSVMMVLALTGGVIETNDNRARKVIKRTDVRLRVSEDSDLSGA